MTKGVNQIERERDTNVGNGEGERKKQWIRQKDER